MTIRVLVKPANLHKPKHFYTVILLYTVMDYLHNFPCNHYALHYGTQCAKCGYIISSSGCTVYTEFLKVMISKSFNCAIFSDVEQNLEI